jgi:hypothetical protein
VNPTDELMAALEGEVNTEVDPSTFDQVTSWVAALVNLRREAEEYDAAYRAILDRLQERRAQYQERVAQRESVLLDGLATYHRIRLSQDPGAKTIPTPAGTLVARKRQDQWEVEDEAAFCEWALQHLPQAVTFPEPKVSKAEAKRALKADQVSDERVIHQGEAVPGIRVRVARPDDCTFDVKDA